MSRQCLRSLKTHVRYESIPFLFYLLLGKQIMTFVFVDHWEVFPQKKNPLILKLHGSVFLKMLPPSDVTNIPFFSSIVHFSRRSYSSRRKGASALCVFVAAGRCFREWVEINYSECWRRKNVSQCNLFHMETHVSFTWGNIGGNRQCGSRHIRDTDITSVTSDHCWLAGFCMTSGFVPLTSCPSDRPAHFLCKEIKEQGLIYFLIFLISFVWGHIEESIRTTHHPEELRSNSYSLRASGTSVYRSSATRSYVTTRKYINQIHT